MEPPESYLVISFFLVVVVVGIRFVCRKFPEFLSVFFFANYKLTKVKSMHTFLAILQLQIAVWIIRCRRVCTIDC
jgi:hypothetical protein